MRRMTLGATKPSITAAFITAMLAKANSTRPILSNRSALLSRCDSPSAPRKSTIKLANASECTMVRLRAMNSTCAAATAPCGCTAMVTIMPSDPAMRARPDLRLSVMRRTLEARDGGVNMPATKMARKRTKRAPLSGNAGEHTGKIDRRVVRTRDILGDALVALMQEKPFESITVQHVLDRAGVSRSTFYEHYEDKNDLFLSDARSEEHTSELQSLRH